MGCIWSYDHTFAPPTEAVIFWVTSTEMGHQQSVYVQKAQASVSHLANNLPPPMFPFRPLPAASRGEFSFNQRTNPVPGLFTSTTHDDLGHLDTRTGCAGTRRIVPTPTPGPIWYPPSRSETKKIRYSYGMRSQSNQGGVSFTPVDMSWRRELSKIEAGTQWAGIESPPAKQVAGVGGGGPLRLHGVRRWLWSSGSEEQSRLAVDDHLIILRVRKHRSPMVQVFEPLFPRAPLATLRTGPHRQASWRTTSATVVQYFFCQLLP